MGRGTAVGAGAVVAVAVGRGAAVVVGGRVVVGAAMGAAVVSGVIMKSAVSLVGNWAATGVAAGSDWQPVNQKIKSSKIKSR
jgi:ABC-type protease/lipase transport system fused ATPase/permease subunit